MIDRLKNNNMSEPNQLTAQENIFSRILILRGQNVIIDTDLATLYGVTSTKLAIFIILLCYITFSNFAGLFDFKAIFSRKYS